ncbi:hypothetical protein JTB14_030899 [Gonioctena quinquepunctata]|nr:hypothetical protein JTB14_030899 [Gonioctena quinquepunctata]
MSRKKALPYEELLNYLDQDDSNLDYLSGEDDWLDIDSYEQGRHYALLNMDSAVIVAIGNKKKSTPIQKNTDSPFYNEYFVFEFFETFSDVIGKQITITVSILWLWIFSIIFEDGFMKIVGEFSVSGVHLRLQ